jgi:hypothetical protein
MSPLRSTAQVTARGEGVLYNLRLSYKYEQVTGIAMRRPDN